LTSIRKLAENPFTYYTLTEHLRQENSIRLAWYCRQRLQRTSNSGFFEETGAHSSPQYASFVLKNIVSCGIESVYEEVGFGFLLYCRAPVPRRRVPAVLLLDVLFSNFNGCSQRFKFNYPATFNRSLFQLSAKPSPRAFGAVFLPSIYGSGGTNLKSNSKYFTRSVGKSRGCAGSSRMY